MKRNIISLSVLLVLVTKTVFAQGFSDQCTSAFEDISSTGTALNLSDDGESNIQIPFSFTLGAVTSSDLRVGNNGAVFFNDTGSDIGYSNQNLSDNSALPGFYPFWDDIDDDTGNVYWEVKGTAPNRYVIIQWDHRPHYNNVGDATFELVLFEGSNTVEFRYADLDFGDAQFDYGASATIGIKVSNTEYYEYSFNTAISNTVSCIAWPVNLPVFDLSTSGDCSNSRFNVQIAVTDLGGANSVTISDDQGSTSRQITTPDTLTFGPYNEGTVVQFTVVNDQNPNLQSRDSITYYCNNNCDYSRQLTVYPENAGSGNEIVQNTRYATSSAYSLTSCDSTGPNYDLFYHFTAPSNGSVKIITGGTHGQYSKIAIYDQCGGNNIACFFQTTNIRKVKNLTPGQDYILQVWHDEADVGSFSIVLEEFTPPSNDDCSNAMHLPVYPFNQGNGNEIQQSTINATASQYSHTSCDSYGTNYDLFYSFTAPASGGIKIITGGNNGSLIEAAVLDACGGTEIDCFGHGPVKTITGLTPGNDYILQVWHDSFNAGEFSIVLEDIENNLCETAYPLTVYPFGQSGGHETLVNTGNAFSSPYANTSCDNDGDNLDLFYSFVAPSNGKVWLLISSGSTGNYRVEYALYDSCGGSAIDCDSRDMGFVGRSKLYKGLTPGQTYYLQVWTDAAYAGSFSIALEEVPPAPANDGCSNPVNLTVYPSGQGAGNETAASTWGATESQYFPSCVRSGYAPLLDLFYTFTAPSNGKVWIKTGGHAGWGVIATIYESCGGNQVACDYTNGQKLVMGLTPGQNYVLQLSTSDAYAGDFTVLLEEVPPAPSNDGCSSADTLTVYPADQMTGNETVFNTLGASSSQYAQTSCDPYGDNLDVFYTFTAPSTGNVIIHTDRVVGIAVYVSCGGSEVACSQPGDTRPLTLTGLNPGQNYVLQLWTDDYIAGEYNVVLGTPPAHDECSGAMPLTVYPHGASNGHEITVNTAHGTVSQYTSLSCDNLSTKPDMFYSFTAPDNGKVWILSNSPYAHVAIYDTCGGQEVYCDNGGPARLVTGLTPGQTYILQTWYSHYFSDTGVYTLALEETPDTHPANDDCSNALPVNVYPFGMGDGNETTFNTWGASESQYGQTSCTFFSPNLDVFYSFTAPSNGQMWIKTLGSPTWRIYATIYNSCGGQEVYCDLADYQSLITGLTPGQNYILQLSTPDSYPGEYNFVLEETAPQLAPNNDCSNAIPVNVYPAGSGQANVTYANTLEASASGLDPSCSYGSYNDLFYTFTAPADGEVWLYTSDNYFPHLFTGVTVYDTCNGNEVYCRAWGTWGQEYRLHHITGLTPGQTYVLQMWTYEYTTREFFFYLEENPPVPANDNCSTPEYLTVYPSGQGAGHETHATTRNATPGPYSNPPCASSSSTNLDLFYEFTAPANGEVNILVNGNSGYWVEGAVYESCGTLPVECIGHIYGTELVTGLTPGQNYILQLWTRDNRAGDFTVLLEETPVPPAFNECATAQALSVYPYGQSAGNETEVYSIYLTSSGIQSSCDPNINNDLDAFFSFTAPASGKIRILYGGPEGNWVRSAIYDTCGGNEIACWYNEPVKIIEGLTPGQAYILKTWQDEGYYFFGPYTVAIEEYPAPPANDECVNAEDLIIYSSCSPTTGTNLGATDSNVPAPSCGNYQGGDIWYSVYVPSGLDTLHIETTYISGSDFKNPAMAVYTGNCNNLNLISCTDDADIANGDLMAKVTVSNIPANTTYYIRLWDFGNNNFGDIGVCAYSPNVTVQEMFAGFFGIFPNPATNSIHWSTDRTIDRIQVIDLSGQVLIDQSKPKENKLYIGKLKSAVYLIKFYSRDDVATFKFVKE